MSYEESQDAEKHPFARSDDLYRVAECCFATGKVSPERRLDLAILIRAFQDAKQPQLIKRYWHGRVRNVVNQVRLEALDWFDGIEGPHFMSYEAICERCDIEPERFLEIVYNRHRRWKKRYSAMGRRAWV